MAGNKKKLQNRDPIGQIVRLMKKAEVLESLVRERRPIPAKFTALFNSIENKLTKLEETDYQTAVRITAMQEVSLYYEKYRDFFQTVVKKKSNISSQKIALEKLNLPSTILGKKTGSLTLLIVTENEINKYSDSGKDQYQHCFWKLKDYFLYNFSVKEISYQAFRTLKNKEYSYVPTPMESSISALKRIITAELKNTAKAEELDAILSSFHVLEKRLKDDSKMRMGFWSKMSLD